MSIKSNQEGKENFPICQSKEVWLFSRDHTAVTCFYADVERHQRCSWFWQVHLHWGKETVRGTVTSPCWFESAFWETRVLTAGNVMLDTAATIPAAHIILQWQVRLWSGGRPAPVRELFRVQAAKAQNAFCCLILSCIYFFSSLKIVFFFFFFKRRTLHSTLFILILITSWAGKVSFLYLTCQNMFFFLVSLLSSLNASSMKFKRISCFCKATLFLTNFPLFSLYFPKARLQTALRLLSFLPSIKCYVQPTEKNGDLEFRMASCRLLSLLPLDLCLNERNLCSFELICVLVLSVSVSKVQCQLS